MKLLVGTKNNSCFKWNSTFNQLQNHELVYTTWNLNLLPLSSQCREKNLFKLNLSSLSKTNSPRSFCKGKKTQNPQRVNNCTVQHQRLFFPVHCPFIFLRGAFWTAWWKKQSSYLNFLTNKLCTYVEAGEDWKKFTLKKTQKKLNGWKYFTTKQSQQNPPSMPKLPSLQQYCNSYSKKKKITPWSASWSPVNWNLSFPLLFTCNQTGEISVNLFPNILAMS